VRALLRAVRVRRQDLVVDPGIWTEDEAFADADAVLLTHHRDHADMARIARLGVPVVAPRDAVLSGPDGGGTRRSWTTLPLSRTSAI
jgi:L-ascorbate metabolism protein UlaG (beta-lactamase superfamily)